MIYRWISRVFPSDSEKGVCDFSSWLNLRLSLETENSSTEHGIPNHDNIGSDIFNMVILCLARRGGKFNLSVRLVENLILSGCVLVGECYPMALCHARLEGQVILV